MKYPALSVSLMLIGLLYALFGLSQASERKLHELKRMRLSARDIASTTTTSSVNFAFNTVATPCSGIDCVTAPTSSASQPCNLINDTTIVAGSANRSWSVLCDIDFFAQDIYPFTLAGSFQKCLQHCQDYNDQHPDETCAGFVFAPDRIHLENDCYMKSSVDNASYPATIHLIGATLLPSTSTSNIFSTTSSIAGPLHTPANGKGESAAVQPSFAPKVVHVKSFGPSTNSFDTQYVNHESVFPIKLASKLLQPGINIDLITQYPLSADTGSWTQASLPFGYEVKNMSLVPRISRDSGKGGVVNGTHVFIFCDTSTFGDVETAMGFMNGFVSSSASIDVGHNAANGKALDLYTPLGQWQDDVGRMRGFIQQTTGEQAFNKAVSGAGYRFAVWPESSPTPLNSTHSVIYAPVVYVEVDMQTQEANYTTLGTTLILIDYDEKFGPHTARLNDLMFKQDEVEWGALGGLRTWTSSGIGTNDGTLYLFGKGQNGILVAKVTPTAFDDRSQFLYWNGTLWTNEIQSDHPAAYMVNQTVMDADFFYAPLHNRFFMIYMTNDADNTFYLRWLVTDNRTNPVVAAYMPGGDPNYGEDIILWPWSEPYVAYQIPTPAEGFAYAGGVQLGYFGADDIANGGDLMMLSWTEHVPRNSSDPGSGYIHRTAGMSLLKG